MSTVSFVHPGTCVIDANQPGDATYDPAPQVQQSFAVGKGSQAIAFTSSAPSSAVVGGPTYDVTAKGGDSGNAVIFTIGAGSASVCSIAGSSVSFTAVGTCTIDANQAGNDDWTAALQKQQSFAVGKGTQSISFTSTAPTSAVVGGPTYEVTATGGASGKPVILSIATASAVVCSLSGSTVSFNGAGTCTIDANQAGDADWNAAPPKQQSFEVAAHGSTSQTIAFDLSLLPAKTYGDAPFDISATASSALPVGFESLTTGVCTVSDTTVTIVAAGTCTIRATQDGNATFAPADPVDQSFTVGKATLTVTASSPAAGTYGDLAPVITPIYGPFVGSDTAAILTTAPSCTTAYVKGDVPNTYATSCSGGVSTRYAFSYVAGSFTVGKATLTVTASSPAAGTYGDLAPVITPIYGPFVGSDTAAILTTAPSCTTAYVKGDVPNTYATSCSGGVSTRYAFSYVAGSFTVGKATLTVTASSPAAGTYGDLAPVITPIYGPFVGSDTAAILTTAPSCTTAYVKGDVPNTYATSCSGGVSTRYAFSYVAGSFTVGKATLTVTASSPAAGTYGDLAPVITPIYGPFVGSDTAAILTTAPSCTTAYVKGDVPNTYATSCSGGVSTRYAFSYVAGSFTVGKATLTVTASSPAAGTYGDLAPVITPIYGPFVGSDTAAILTTAPSCTTAYVKGDVPNTYATSCSGGVSTRYAFSYVAGSFTVGKATLTVTASSPAAGTYGDLAPVITPIYGPFVGSDTAAILTTAPSCTTAYVKGDVPNTYATSCSGGVSTRYAFSYVAGSFTVGKATLTVTASSPAAGTYGDLAPVITPIYGPFVGSDTAAILTTAPSCTTAYVKGDVPNTYATSCSGGVSTRYAFSYVAGSFTVGKATLTVTASSPAAGTYGDLAPVITPIYGPFVGSDTAAILTTAPSCTTAYVKGDVPNTYATSCSGGVSTRYAFSYVAGSFTVGKATLTVTADNQAVIFGDTDPLFTFTYGPFVGTDTGASIDTPPTCSVSGAHTGVAGSPYTIECSGGLDNDYTFDYVTGQLTIAKADQEITFSDAPIAPIVGQTYDVSAKASSGLVVVLSIDPASAAVCTISGGTVTFTAVGGCHINAEQAGDADWNAATDQQVVGVGDVAPLCPDAPASVVMNVAKSGSAGCTDHEHDPMTYAIVADAAHGSASIDAAGTWTYTPALNYRGADSFTLKANDGILDSTAATITITVSNLPLDARNDSVAFVRPLDATVIKVLANDSPGAGETGQPLTITAVSNGARGRVTTDGSTVSYDPNGCSTGVDTFTYTVTDGQYSATKTVFLTIARPGQNGMSSNPVTDTPALGFVTNSTIGSTVPAKLSWCGVTKSGYSVHSYTVGQSTNGGSSYASKAIISSTATSSTRNLSLSTTYRWRARTIDSGHHTGSYKTSVTSRISRYQENSTAIAWAGSWGNSTSGSPSGGAEKYTTVKGASATIYLTNVRQFAVVGPRSTTRGSFEVWVDGSKVATISEHASSTVYRRVLYVRSLTSGAGVTHRIEIRAVGNGRIDLDAILALS